MIDEYVDKLYKKLDTHDSKLIAKERKIDVLRLPLDSDTCGLTVRNSRFSTIIINDLINDPLQEYTLCHELGHCIMHQSASTPFMRNFGSSVQVSKNEAEAHRFAFELLRRQYDELNEMPNESVLEFWVRESVGKVYIKGDNIHVSSH